VNLKDSAATRTKRGKSSKSVMTGGKEGNLRSGEGAFKGTERKGRSSKAALHGQEMRLKGGKNQDPWMPKMGV